MGLETGLSQRRCVARTLMSGRGAPISSYLIALKREDCSEPPRLSRGLQEIVLELSPELVAVRKGVQAAPPLAHATAWIPGHARR